jgi:uncharacterized protein YdaT
MRSVNSQNPITNPSPQPTISSYTSGTISGTTFTAIEPLETEKANSLTAKIDSQNEQSEDLRKPASDENDGWLMGSVKALTGIATRLTLQTLNVASPYLTAVADTAYETAKTESPVVKRFDEAANQAAVNARDLRSLGEEMVASADRTAKHLETLKAERAATTAASEAISRSGGALIQRMAIQGAAATACVAGLSALQQALAGGATTGIIASLPFSAIPLGTAALAGSAIALLSPEGLTFCRAAQQLTQSLFASGSAGTEAAAELAESAVSAQRTAGMLLQNVPSTDFTELVKLAS